jgi:hypothetical protein
MNNNILGVYDEKRYYHRTNKNTAGLNFFGGDY